MTILYRNSIPKLILNENLDCGFEISSTAIISTKQKASVTEVRYETDCISLKKVKLKPSRYLFEHKF